jgi:hypothetical protein
VELFRRATGIHPDAAERWSGRAALTERQGEQP